jgi:hypothetical protein
MQCPWDYALDIESVGLYLVLHGDQILASGGPTPLTGKADQSKKPESTAKFSQSLISI